MCQKLLIPLSRHPFLVGANQVSEGIIGKQETIRKEGKAVTTQANILFYSPRREVCINGVSKLFPEAKKHPNDFKETFSKISLFRSLPAALRIHVAVTEMHFAENLTCKRERERESEKTKDAWEKSCFGEQSFRERWWQGTSTYIIYGNFMSFIALWFLYCLVRTFLCP